MASVLGALGLYNGSQPLAATGGAGGGGGGLRIVLVGRCRFAAKAYFEKTVCGGARGRRWCGFVVNERVLPLASFGADGRGLVPLERFVDALSFVRAGGDWVECFV